LLWDRAIIPRRATVVKVETFRAMALRLYFDDCANFDLLTDLPRQAGQDVARSTAEIIAGEFHNLNAWR
jgi:hypothetical protein